jgi:TfoX/Sxy family transcriptional regulator of competence genes
MSTKKTKTKSGDVAIDSRFEPVVAAFARDRQVTAGMMMASVGLKVNGKIFAMMSRGKFVAKLPKARVDELVASGAGVYFDPRRDGRVMKEWIELSGAKPPWIELAREAHRFVKSKA